MRNQTGKSLKTCFYSFVTHFSAKKSFKASPPLPSRVVVICLIPKFKQLRKGILSLILVVSASVFLPFAKNVLI
jgi:hypothetical protein